MSLLVECRSSLPLRITETLSNEVLDKMKAPPKPDYPIIVPNELPKFDAYLFGIPTRYGNFPAQWKVGTRYSVRCVARELISSRVLKAFWDATGALWVKGALMGKFAGVFVSTGTPGGGQEATVMNSLSTLTHHGMIFVPLGYNSITFSLLSNLEEVRGGKCLLFRSTILGV